MEDISHASDAALDRAASSPDRLLGCAARDEIKRRRLEKEQALPGPASPELCAELGINPSDLKEFLACPRPNTGVQPASSLPEKEILLTTVATYLANKDSNWWVLPEQVRSRELDFVIRKLLLAFKGTRGTP
jgi:hypothetical protein